MLRISSVRHNKPPGLGCCRSSKPHNDYLGTDLSSLRWGDLNCEHCNSGACGRRTDLDRPFITCIFYLLLSCLGSRHQTGLSGHRLRLAHNGDVFISSWPLAQGQGLEPVRAWIGTPLIELGLIVQTDATRDSRPFSHVEEATLASVCRGLPRGIKSGSLLLFFSSGDQN